MCSCGRCCDWQEGMLSELLYAGNLVVISSTIEGCRNKFAKWKKGFESKGLKVNLGKAKVMVCGGITNDCMSEGKANPYGICSLRLKANWVLCSKWIHSICALVKM